ncbi:MAG: DUF4178 domain-containing protein [Patescibacteria group bacterium]
MTIKDLLALELGESVSVFNQPFEYAGRSEVTLDDDAKVYWLFDDEDRMLSISPDDDELVLFDRLEEEVEADDSIFLHGKEYEFSYENAGKITDVDGSAETEQEDRYLFTEHQSADGERLRIISNENSGEAMVYLGKTVSEDDLSEI